MNIPYLLNCLKTTKYSDLVTNIDLPLLDINLLLWEAEAAGEIEIDRDKDRIKVLVDPFPWRDEGLANKIIRAIQHYNSKERNLTVGALNSWVKTPGMDHNYPWHEYVATLQSLIDDGQVLEHEISVPKSGKRPYHKFVFLCLPGNPNEEWNAREVNKFIASWKPNKVK
ncbi:MAG TPA: hypothetical protein VD907_06940 [Verrucomicrobiae bacterium]|nr:hypothetical protein [Verrucomicrobiae bacterium]